MNSISSNQRGRRVDRRDTVANWTRETLIFCCQMMILSFLELPTAASERSLEAEIIIWHKKSWFRVSSRPLCRVYQLYDASGWRKSRSEHNKRIRYAVRRPRGRRRLRDRPTHTQAPRCEPFGGSLLLCTGCDWPSLGETNQTRVSERRGPPSGLVLEKNTDKFNIN